MVGKKSVKKIGLSSDKGSGEEVGSDPNLYIFFLLEFGYFSGGVYDQN